MPQNNTPTKILNQVNNNQGLTYDFYYRPDCKDCQNMQRQGLNKLLHATNKTNPVNAVNTTKFKAANQKQATSWFSSNYVLNTPTLILRYNGYPVALYSGTNLTSFKRLLNQRDPKTNHKLNLINHPNSEIVQNDFNHSHYIIDSQKITSLTTN